MELFDTISHYWKMQLGVTIAVTGCMKSGKTEQLKLALMRCSIAEYPYSYITHELDKERRKNHAASSDHGSIHITEEFFTNTSDLEYLAQSPRRVIGINEVQFADDPILDFIDKLASSGHIVITAGLDNTSDHTAFPFRTIGGARDHFSTQTMYDLIGRSNVVFKLHAVCMYRTQEETCDNPAYYTKFLGDSKGIIKTGSKEYEPRCALHKTAD